MSHKATSELPHWHEYNIGLAGSVARTVMGTLAPFLIGLLACVVIAIAIGFVGEEGIVGDAALALGYPEAAAATLAGGIDQFTRMSLLPIALIAYLSVAAMSATAFVRDRATSRALAAAADAGAARHAVPTPEQIGAVITDGYPGLSWFLGGNAVLFGFMGVLFVPISLAQDFTSGAWMGLGMCLYAGIHGLLALRIPKVARPAQQERRRRIAAHWTTEHERAVWNRARKWPRHTGNALSPGAAPRARDWRIRLGSWVQSFATMVGVVGGFLLVAVIYLTHPEAQLWRGGQLGPRGDYAPRLELVFNTATVLGSAVILGSLVLLFVGLGLASLGRNSEKSKLAHILKVPTATRPSKDLLQPYGEPHSFLFSQLLAGCAGAALIVSSTVLLLGTVQWESFRDSALLFGAFRSTSFVATLLSLTLLLLAFVANAVDQSRGRDLRNRLMQRWPTLPAEKPDDEGNVPLHRAGPALSGPRGR